jgi:hypothetical protein
MASGTMAPSGALYARKITPKKAPLAWRVQNSLRWSYILGWLTHKLGHAFTALTGAPVMLGELHGRLIRRDGTVIDYGCLGRRVVTTAYVNFLVDELQTSQATHSTIKFHASGTSSTAESSSDTTLGTEVEASRTSGTQTENAANIYESVGAISYTTTRAIVEHGLFSASTTGTLMDRTVFSVINVLNGDSISFTYRITMTAGS